MLDHLERTYNDGTRYALHYITAREAYNLAIAAATGASGPPELYMDTPVAPYVSSARPEIIDARHQTGCPADSTSSATDECAR